MSQRLEHLARLEGRVFDLLVIGGGIVGAGVARDAALRGLSTALVEQHDLAFGTSSRSSRLLHGGLRYLAQGRLRLVREASVEKRVLHRIAPHLSQPLPFFLPTYAREGWPRWQMAVGIKVYDLLCGGRNLGPSSVYSARGALTHVDGLRAAGLTGGVRYFDALTNDARLVLDTLRSAARAGAAVCNYLRVDEVTPATGKWLCPATDVESGRVLRLAARAVVNATGPWASRVPDSQLRLRLTKGIHLVIDRRRLPIPDAVATTHEGRLLFALPWGERVILGSTDTDYEGRPEDARTEPADVEYVLGVLNAVFPAAALAPRDCIADWAGVRPLLAGGGGPSDISRRHEIRSPRPGLFEIAGGKLTTYRLIAEQAVDSVARYLNRPLPRCITAERLLVDSDAAASAAGACVLPPPVERRIVEAACRDEWTLHLDDLMRRRTSWHYYHAADRRAEIAATAAEWMATALGWDDACRRDELDRYARSV